MKWPLTICLASILWLHLLPCHSHNSFSFGGKLGLGAQVIPAKSEFPAGNTYYPVQTNPSLLQGVTGQYMIGNKAGIETGIQAVFYSYTKKGDDNYLYNVFNKPAAIFLTDWQIPILLMYNFEHRFNEMRHFKIVAGTSLDYLSVHFSSVQNFIAGFRITKDKLNSRIEYSLEHQYSFKRFTITEENDDQTEDRLDTRLSTLTLSVTWFFCDKTTSAT
jgi:hypothetical protein